MSELYKTMSLSHLKYGCQPQCVTSIHEHGFKKRLVTEVKIGPSRALRSYQAKLRTARNNILTNCATRNSWNRSRFENNDSLAIVYWGYILLLFQQSRFIKLCYSRELPPMVPIFALQQRIEIQISWREGYKNPNSISFAFPFLYWWIKWFGTVEPGWLWLRRSEQGTCQVTVHDSQASGFSVTHHYLYCNFVSSLLNMFE